MMRFPAAAIALGRAVNEANLLDSCSVEEPTASDDGEGGAFVEWVAGDSLPCRVSPMGSPSERIQAGQPARFERWQVVFAAEAVLPNPCRLRVTRGTETLLLAPEGANAPRTYEMLRKYECVFWTGRDDEEPEGS